VDDYRVETAIGKNQLTATAELSFTAVAGGDRVLGFGLLPTLRVTRVSTGEREFSYIQEKQKEDGSFYIIVPERLVKGRHYRVTIEYQGAKVIEDAGGGNFAVGARTSWYPSVNAFTDRSRFDLTFKVPKQFTLVGVGRLMKEWKEGDYAASQWTSDVPLAVAGFNYGRFTKKELADEPTKCRIEGYATAELPDYLRGARDIGGMTPSRLTERPWWKRRIPCGCSASGSARLRTGAWRSRSSRSSTSASHGPPWSIFRLARFLIPRSAG
jgi:hypothetical protein